MLTKLFLNSQSKFIISNDISVDKINHSYLISCDDVDKLNEFSKYIACMLLCESKLGDKPCFNCGMCKKIICGTHADVSVYPKGKILTVEESKLIANECFVVPIESDKKIIIINNIDLARTDSQNKLLKTLEEPPKNVVFILTCSNIEGVLPTIRSRVKIIYENLANSEDMLDDLSDQVNLKNIAELVQYSNGNLTRFNEFVANKSSLKVFDLCLDVLLNLKKSGDVLKFSYLILEEKDNLQLFFIVLTNFLGELLNVKMGKKTNFLNKEKELEIVAKEYPINALVKIIEKCGEINQRMKFNCNPAIIVDNFLLYVLEVKYLCCRI